MITDRQPDPASPRPPRLLDRLSRRTSSGRFIPEVDGMRFVSIGLVVVYHLAGFVAARSPASFAAAPRQDWSYRLAGFGDHGVQLFFIISGFILGLPFAAHHLAATRRPRLRDYFLRRVTRLEPPYIASMLLFFVLLVVVNGANAAELFPHLLASVLYLHNLAFGVPSTINGVAWSLEVEVQFYILAPLLATVFAVRRPALRRAIMIGVSAAIIALQTFVFEPRTRWTLSILGSLQFFLIGFLLADVYLTEWRGAPTTTAWWDLAWLLGWPALYLVWILALGPELLFPVLAFLLFVGAFRGRISRRIVANPWLATIGGMCYTIYLFHFQIISAVGRLTVRMTWTDSFTVNLLVQALLVLPAVLAVSTAIFVLLERPCMEKDWPQRFGRWLRGLRMRRPTEAAPLALRE